MACPSALPRPRQLLVALLVASWAVTGVLGQSSGSSSSSASMSSSVGYCDGDDVGKWLTSSILTQCGEGAGYNFSSGLKPTETQARAFCDSSCFNLFQLGLTSTDECILPYGDHIYLVADLIKYVLGVCATSSDANSESGSDSNRAGSSSASASSSAFASSSGDGSTVLIAIGCGVGAAALIALLTWLCWRRRRQLSKHESTNGSATSREGYVPMLSDVNRDSGNGLLAAEPRGHHSRSNATATTASTASSAFSSASRKKRARLSELSPWRVDVESVQDIERVGHGAHCVVWQVLYRGSTVLASKRIQSDQVSQQLTQSFVDEILLLSHLQHPNIVTFVGVAWTKQTDLQVLLEFMDVGNLRDYLLRAETPRVWTLQKLSIAHDIVQALVYVHSFQPPLLHRDLKSHNVMLTTNGFQDGDPRATMVVQTALTAKLTDFGVSRFHSENNTMTIGVGTSRWLAPEVIVGETNYGPEADMYSFGVVLSELDTHALPYDDEQTEDGESLANVAILQRVALGELKPAFNTKTCIPELLALAQRCLQHDASKRPSAPMVAYELRKMMKAKLDT